MITQEQIVQNSQYESEILELIENHDEYTQSDLQGIVGAIILKIQQQTS